MYIAYYDESGDDGFPKYSSPLFSLSALYLHYLEWRPTYDAIQGLRAALRSEFALPVRMEFHTRDFVLNKYPYRTLGLTDETRLGILDKFCDALACFQLKSINIIIVKPRIKAPEYSVLDTALKFSIQRIENDLDPAVNPERRFMIITDAGRVGKMRTTARRIQRINYIPSRYGAQPYRREISTLIEDPLPKDSKESYFIQMADLVSYVVYLYATVQSGVASFHGRIPSLVTADRVLEWMGRLRPILNLKATSRDPFGVVFHP